MTATVTRQASTPNLSRYYSRRQPSIVPGDFEFQLDLLRPRQPPFPLATMVDQLSWDDEATALTGSINAWRPDPERPSSLPIARGHLVRCRVKWAGSQIYQLWTMRCDAPQVSVDTGQVSVTLQDDLALVDNSELDWYFRKTRARPHGWTADEVTRSVAKTLGLRVGEIPKGEQRFELVKRRTSGLATIKAAWGQEKSITGVGYVLRIRNGALEVAAIRRNPLLYVLGPQIQTALITQKTSVKTPVSALTGQAHMKVGRRVQKLSFTIADPKVVAALGYVPKTKNYGRVSSHAVLRSLVKADYSAGLRVNDQITIKHQGVPFIYRGDGVEVLLPAEGYSGQQGFVYATRATHTVQAGVYTTEWDFTVTDPFVAELNAEQKARSAAIAKSSGRNLSTVGTGQRWRVVASSEDDPPGTTASCGPLPADRRGYSVASISGLSSDVGTAGQALSPGALWPCGTVLKLTNPANGQSTTAPHVDNGAGDSFQPIVGIYPQTRAELGLPNGWNGAIIIERVDGGSLSPVRGTKV